MKSRHFIIRKLRDFSNERKIADHLSKRELTNFLLRQDIPGLLRALYMHPIMPSNHCVYYDATVKMFKIYTRGLWIHQHKKDVQRELIETAYRVLRFHFNANVEDIHDICVQTFHTEPNFYKIECWLEEIWEDRYDDTVKLYKDVTCALTKSEDF